MRFQHCIRDKANWDIHQKALNKTIADLNEAITSLNNIITLTNTAKLDLQVHLAVIKKMEEEKNEQKKQASQQ